MTYRSDPASSQAAALAWMLQTTGQLAVDAVRARAHLAALDPADPMLDLLDELPGKLHAAISPQQ